MSMRKAEQRGINLIELMVAMSIAAVSLTVGVPSFQGLRISQDRSSAIIELVSSARLARSEAAVRGTPASICASTDGATCSGETDWTQGWLVFRDTDGDLTIDAGDDLVKQVRFQNPHFTITADSQSGITNGITFKQFGYIDSAQATGKLQYSDEQQSRCLDITFMGRFDVNDGDCP